MLGDHPAAHHTDQHAEGQPGPPGTLPRPPGSASQGPRRSRSWHLDQHPSHAMVTSPSTRRPICTLTVKLALDSSLRADSPIPHHNAGRRRSPYALGRCRSSRARSAVRRVSHSSLGDRGRDAELGFQRGMQLAGRRDRASYGGRCYTSSSSIRMPLGTRDILDNSRKR